MKRKLAFIMAAIMLVTTPASVLASESMDVSAVSEDMISEDENTETYVDETPEEENYVEEADDVQEDPYEASDEDGAGQEDVVFIEDGVSSADSAADAAETTEYGDDDFIISIEEVPTILSEVMELDDNNIVASGECGDKLTWVLDDAGTLTISGTGPMTDWTSHSDTPWNGYITHKIYSVVIEEEVTTVGNYAFDEAMELANVSLPDSLVSIGDRAFRDCDSLKSIEIPESVVSIGVGAFFMCGIKSIVIPKGITSIGSGAFSESSVKDVYYDGTVQEWARIDMPISYADEGDYDPLIMATFHFGGESESIIAGGACGDDLIWKLDDNDTMTISGTGRMIDFGEDLTGVWNARKQNIFTLVVKDGASSIGDRAFWGLDYLRDVVISDTVTEIGCYAFGNCDNLTNFTIPNAVTKIGDYAFAYCDSLETITIPNSVISIGGNAFRNCVSLKQITIPDSITSIGNFIFCGCTSLSEVTLSQNIKGISQYAFSGCTSLTDVVLPDKCQEIASYAFQNCSALKSITFSNSMTGIGEAAFDGCSSLKDVYFKGSKSQWEKINISTSNLSLTTNATIHFSIEDLSSNNVSLSQTSYTYDGSAKKPTVTVKNSADNKLTSGTDYTVDYKNNTNAGTATVTVTGKGDYTGSVKKNFTINKASQTLSAKVSSSIVKGKTATITASGKGTISYSSNKKSVATVSSKGKITAKAIGTAKITVKAAGNSNYKSASKTLTIKVIPKATTLSSAKSSSSKKLTVKWKKVSGVTGYQIQYSTSKTFKSGNKTVTVSGASKVSKTISKLKKGKTYYVRVRTYKKVSGTKYYSSWTSKKKVKVK